MVSRRQLVTLSVLCGACGYIPVASSFSGLVELSRRKSCRQQQTLLYSKWGGPRTGVRLPLLDVSDESSWILPLPSSHLPAPLTTPYVYGMSVHRPVHRMLMDNAVSEAKAEKILSGASTSTPPAALFGHVAWRDPLTSTSDDKMENHSLLGAIGCATEILAMDKKGSDAEDNSDDDKTADSVTCLVRGSFRFVVKEVVQIFPYPVAIVDQLVDRHDQAPSTVFQDPDEMYSDLSVDDIISRIKQAMDTLLERRLEPPPTLSPLEQSILEQVNTASPLNLKNAMNQEEAQEMTAVWDVFIDSVLEDYLFALGIMAAEIGQANNELRTQMLIETNGVQRLRIVLKELDRQNGLASAQKLAETIVEESSDPDEKELKVGTPEMPPWTKSIQIGMRVEYYWSEADGWCAGAVAEKPMKVVDELIITVLFDDGETHRLPFHPEEKVRWRPPQ
uniref:Uncharacterized protein n=1 Tax=Attheya septentrionalis TaxID=420275 RepID=A0A7S2XLB9_9STRA|mmetsp:Transcript_17994/g.32618  ORF Transcript_17994/g.32618 Transcript_17994/m.32618 type:complete len:448 (+) Transcript_17994:44-1387(+)|eukprot:CAMPEP_0198293332 /NCGR_PEP_ID=MMETSP1449-20131203/16563_1 /TAXON_ID=420275 /ORGANISM="Attheya septentrionalis, Strain CCMP2084" /LENGTH=447 /DNA_ID=CAMNT_0043992875 /DNA_START=21 /DNA_END=1364 /DNA_ORIENTATION=-